MSLKLLVKRWGRKAGFDFKRYRPDCFMQLISKSEINLVLDVGANTGQFGRQLRFDGYRGRIVSFEPLSNAYEKLLATSRNDRLWEVAPRVAIGNENGEIVIHVAGNSVSSSALTMLDAHRRASPESVYVGSERVPLRTLDMVATKYLNSDSIFLVKIDTQGYEDRILKGATDLLQKAAGLQLELSFIPLYDGQCLFDEVIDQLRSIGFELWGLSPAFVDPHSGRLLQVDATFSRIPIV